MKLRTISILAVIAVALAPLQGCASLRPVPQQATPLEEAAEASSLHEPIFFTLGPADELQITVWNIPELDQLVTVDPNGQISIPMAGIIDVNGKTITDVTQILQQNFENYYVNPEVTVAVRSSRSNKIGILGEVKNPGVFAMVSETRLMDALALAGDFTIDAEPKTVALIRGDLQSPQIYLLDVNRLITKGDLNQNVMLQKGDIVYVPRSKIANVDAFFLHLYTIIRPVVELERGLILLPNIEDAFSGQQTIQIVR